MWSKTYSKKIHGVKVEDIWQVWSDVNQWHIWQDDLEYAKLEGKFEVGNKFLLKPKQGPKVTIELIQVEINKSFIDLTRFPGAKMYGSHEFISDGDELEIKTTMSVTGLLGFVWRKLVAEKIADSEEEQTRQLIEQTVKLAKNP